MKKLDGAIKIDGPPFPNARRVADLVYYDGPLLSLFRDNRGSSYLYHWCDSDETCNRWLCFGVSEQILDNLMRQQKTVRQACDSRANRYFWIEDINTSLENKATYILGREAVPPEYMPNPELIIEDDPIVLASNQNDARPGGIHNIWPDDLLETIPIPPVQFLREAAKGLGAKTNQIVLADATFYGTYHYRKLELTLRVPSMGNYRYGLMDFLLPTAPPDLYYPIETDSAPALDEGETRTLSDQSAFEQFVAGQLNSPETRRIIQSLVAQVQLTATEPA